MSNRISSCNLMLLATVSLSLIRIVSAAPVCTTNSSGPDICVEWPSGTPVLLLDFDVNYSDPANPSVILRTGNVEWTVYSDAGSSAVGAIGTISIDATTSTHNFPVKIQTSTGGAGATNVGSINLNDTTSWTGHSSLTGGIISGNLTGALIVKADGSNNGGSLHFTIEGNATSNIEAYRIAAGNELQIKGDLASTATINIHKMETDNISLAGQIVVEGNAAGDVEVNQLDSASAIQVDGNSSGDITAAIMTEGARIEVYGSLSGDIQVTDELNRSFVWVHGDVESTATITVHEMIDYAKVYLATEEGYEFAGDLILTNGIPSAGQVVIAGESTATSSVDLNHANVGGSLNFDQTCRTTIVNGGSISGVGGVKLSTEAGHAFVGSATFASIVDNGSLRITGTGLHMGTIVISGDVNSTTNFGAESIDVETDFAGDIRIEGNLVTNVYVAGDLRGTGRIMVAGELRGEVKIDGGTVDGSLISTNEGITSSGKIIINASESNKDAGVNIRVGVASAPFGDVTFDGTICIKDNTGGTDGGDLIGAIRVNGCHASSADLDICIGGSITGGITISQTGCSPTVSYSCVSSCS